MQLGYKVSLLTNYKEVQPALEKLSLSVYRRGKRLYGEAL